MFTPYKEVVKSKERVDMILASETIEELYKVLYPLSLEERLQILDEAMEQCERIAAYYHRIDNQQKSYKYLSLEGFLQDVEAKYRALIMEI